MIYSIGRLSVPGVSFGKIKDQIDYRGSFTKLFHASTFGALLPNFELKESYITKSEPNVLRGMHFQLPPDDHYKVVICLKGHVLDVVLDLRRGKTYGKTDSIELKPENFNIVFIPKGIAHGFYAFEHSDLLYMVSSEYSLKNDAGIMWNSFDFDWPNQSPILSERDKTHQAFLDFLQIF